jgi:NRAMP (natural resistance-associated macrophage protein)-like metal ion transporter
MLKAETPEGRREDKQDLQRAQTNSDPTAPEKPWYKSVGPGLVTGAADDDPSGIGTYSATGAQSGYFLLWLVPFCIPLMIAVQEMCGRVGAVTGHGLAAVLKEHYPRWLLYGSVFLLIGANVFNVYADLNVMAASATMLFHVPFWMCLTLIAVVIAALQIIVPYRIYARLLKWLCLSLLGYVVVALLPGVHNDWGAIFKSLLVPHLKANKDSMLLVVAFLGTTISPYLFFWQAGETVEDEVAEGHADRPGHRTHEVSDREIRNVRADTAIGMIASQAVALFIMVAAAGALNRTGHTEINTAQDAAKALLPLGPAAYWIFTICIIGTGLLAIPTLAGSAAYAVAETAGWRYGLYRRFKRAYGFYITIALVVLIGYGMNFIGAISPVKALVYSAALNGIVAPPLIVVLLLICNNRKVVGNRTNGPWANIFGWASVILMAPAAVYLIYASVSGG